MPKDFWSYNFHFLQLWSDDIHLKARDHLELQNKFDLLQKKYTDQLENDPV